MCLAVPMKVVEIKGEMGVVENKGVKREVGFMLLEDVKIDDWVLIHAGFAITKLLWLINVFLFMEGKMLRKH